MWEVLTVGPSKVHEILSRKRSNRKRARELLWQRTQVQSPALTWCHTTVCHSKARGSNALFYVISHQAHMWYIDTCSGKMPIYVE